MNKSIVTKRALWLKRRGLTPRQFAEATNQYTGTVYTWFKHGRTPRKPYLGAVLSAFPDWPVAQ